METNLLLAIWITLLLIWAEHSPIVRRARKFADNQRWSAILIFILVLLGIYINGK